jgi:mannose-6-phosphate isomerase-like protein (cupin superfamily)
MPGRFIGRSALAGLVLAASAASAQAPAPGYRLAAADVARIEAELRAKAKAENAPAGLAYVMKQGPFALRMDVRSGPAPDVHAYPTQGEFFMILSGTGAVSMGGRLVDPHLQGEELRAPTSTGGQAYTVGPGDVLLIAENTPFSITKVNGELVLATVHLPHPAAPAPAQQGPASQGAHAFISGKAIAGIAAGSPKAAPLLSAGPFASRLEVFSGPSPADWSGGLGAQLFLCLSGSGVMTLGGQTYPVAKGDFILLPEGAPRSIQKTDGKLVLLSMPLPRPAAE